MGSTARGGLLAAGLLLGVAGLSWAVWIPEGGVLPRIFTPNGDGINDTVIFEVVTPSLENVEGTIYDAHGLVVAELAFLSPTPPPGTDPQTQLWMWDGKDRNGNIAPAGVYIYQVRGGGKSITGTVVVAK